MQGGRRIAFILAVAAVAVLAATLVMPSAYAPSVDQDLVDQYPDADFIVSDGGRSTVLITYRTVDDEGNPAWEVRSVSSGSSLNLTDLTSSVGGLKVVMTGGSLGNLTLMQADEVLDNAQVDVEFLMTGGSLSDLRVLSVPSYLEGDLGNSYVLMAALLGDVVLDLRGGTIGDLIPTDDMVSVNSLTVGIHEGMNVDRMLASGSNGRYDIVTVNLEGGSVGYMANERSVVGVLNYEFRSGSVDYFCIGADTENGSNNNLSNLNTFYVQGDVHVHVDTAVAVRQAVIGGGIIDIPAILWNGSAVTPSLARNVEIVAPGMPLTPDTCFMTSNRTQGNVYQFSSYTTGGTPRTRPISTDYYQNSTRHPVYGEEGVWSSATDMTVEVGQYLYVEAELTVASGSTLTVDAGGRLVNSGNIYLSGILANGGLVMNSGVIEKREGGTIQGDDPQGDGFVAYCINVNPTDGRIDVMASDDDTVVLRTDGTVYISRISVLLENGDREVRISVPETLYVGGDRFLVSLRETDDPSGYSLEVGGIDPEVLRSLTIEITVPCDIPQDTDCYVYDIETGHSMEIVDRSYGEITFLADGAGLYHLSTISPEGIDESVTDDSGENLLNIALAIVIVVVGAVVVYILLKKD